MWGEQIAKILAALPPIIWSGIVAALIYLGRDTLQSILNRLSGLEAFGLKLLMSGERALDAAVSLATKHPNWHVDVPEADRKRAIERAERARCSTAPKSCGWTTGRRTTAMRRACCAASARR